LARHAGDPSKTGSAIHPRHWVRPGLWTAHFTPDAPTLRQKP
jgi:hypothetical protein